MIAATEPFDKNFDPAHKMDHYQTIMEGDKVVDVLLAPNPLDVAILGSPTEIKSYKKLKSRKMAPAPPVSHKNNTVNPPGGGRGAAGIIAVIGMVNYVLKTNYASAISSDVQALAKHKAVIDDAFDDFQSGVKAGLVPPEYANDPESMSEIMNVIVQGETVKGNQELYQIGLDVLEFSGNLQLNQVEQTITIPLNPDGSATQVEYIFKTKENMVDPALEKKEETSNSGQ